MDADVAPRLPGSPAREFSYARRDFQRVREMIYAHAGISLNDSKTEMVYSRLARRLRMTGHREFGTYLDMLADDAHPEWEHFVNALTTNLTEFFREAHHYPVLAQHARASSSRPYRVWSAACSTGEEPYSLAMTLCEAFQTDEPPVDILATDLDTQVLDKGAAGIYEMDRVDGLDSTRLKRFFLRGTGTRAGQVRVRANIRKLVRFQQLNFHSAEWGVSGQFDAVFCRNVLIYFDKPTQHRVLRRLSAFLSADGLFFAGHSESLLHAADVFTPIGKTVYRPAAANRGRLHG
ncbi:MAG: chemotaxis protein CheR [Betaproteobacteria bacterium]|nr:chemotaxis protein CheR [Betaproteobacteria bacterium]